MRTPGWKAWVLGLFCLYLLWYIRGDHCHEDKEWESSRLIAPGGRHVAETFGVECSGFRVEPALRVRIRAANEHSDQGTVVFHDPVDNPQIEWIDADHLLITMKSIFVSGISASDAKGVKILYRLDPPLTEAIRANYEPQVEGDKSARSWAQENYGEFVEWAKTHTGFRPTSNAPPPRK